MSLFTKLVGDIGIDKVITSITDSVDRFVTTKEEKEQLKHAVQKDLMAFELEYLKDKQNAREMYRYDSWLQKVYAITFLVAYILLTGAMMFLVYKLAMNQAVVPDWAIAFISSIWGAMSTKVGTITDFLFGSSKGSADKTEHIKLQNQNKS